MNVDFLIKQSINQKYVSLKIEKIEKKYLKYRHSFNEEISSLIEYQIETYAKNIKT